MAICYWLPCSVELTGSSLLYICWLHICLKETRSNCFGVLAAMLCFLHPKKFSFHSFRSRPVKATICLLSKGLLISHILLKTYSQVLRVKIIKAFRKAFFLCTRISRLIGGSFETREQIMFKKAWTGERAVQLYSKMWCI